MWALNAQKPQLLEKSEVVPGLPLSSQGWCSIYRISALEFNRLLLDFSVLCVVWCVGVSQGADGNQIGGNVSRQRRCA